MFQSPAALRVTKAPHARPAPETLPRARVDAHLAAYSAHGPLAGALTGVQSDTTPGLMALWVESFKRHHPGVAFDVYIGGSGQAGPTLTGGTVDFAVIARELLPKEEGPFQQRFGYAPLRVAVAGGSYRTVAFTDALAFFVHPDNPIERLSFGQLDAIYSRTRRRGQAEVTTWGQVGLTGEWANKPISLYGVRPQNGFEQFLVERVLLGGAWKDSIEVRDTVFPLPRLVAADRYGLGYAGLAYLEPGVKPLAVAGREEGPYFTGTFEEVLEQRYPLSRHIYLFANRRPGEPLDPALRAFAQFCLSREGQQAVAQDGVFLPLPARVVEQELARLG